MSSSVKLSCGVVRPSLAGVISRGFPALPQYHKYRILQLPTLYKQIPF